MECAVAGYNLKKKKKGEKPLREPEYLCECILNKPSHGTRNRSVFRTACGKTKPEQLDHLMKSQPSHDSRVRKARTPNAHTAGQPTQPEPGAGSAAAPLSP